MTPKMFIGCSAMSLEIARAVQESLGPDIETQIWNQGHFRPSSTILNSVVKASTDFDYGLFILSVNEKDDSRDNIMLEMGIFIGQMGFDRVFLMVPQNSTGFSLPSDLMGFVTLEYDNANLNNDISVSLSALCNKIRREIKRTISDIIRPVLKSHIDIIFEPNVGSIYAARRVSSSSLVRVVGTARQEVLHSVPEAMTYLRTTEDRAKLIDKFTYLRITSNTLVREFRDHLCNMVDISSNNIFSTVEIAIENQLDVSISYTIFDLKEVLLVIDNTVFGNTRDNRLMVSIKEEHIVRSFADHFDHAWSRLNIKCKNKDQIIRYTNVI